MTKAEFIDKVAAKSGLTKRDAVSGGRRVPRLRHRDAQGRRLGVVHRLRQVLPAAARRAPGSQPAHRRARADPSGHRAEVLCREPAQEGTPRLHLLLTLCPSDRPGAAGRPSRRRSLQPRAGLEGEHMFVYPVERAARFRRRRPARRARRGAARAGFRRGRRPLALRARPRPGRARAEPARGRRRGRRTARLARRAESGWPLRRATICRSRPPRFVVVDLETTGLRPGRSAICEIGAVRVESLLPAGTFQTLVDPGVPLPPVITGLTGIEDRDLRGAPRPGAAVRSVPRVRGRARRASSLTTPASTSLSSTARSSCSPGGGSRRRSSTRWALRETCS